MSNGQHIHQQPAAWQHSTVDWYVIHCQPRKERYAAMALQEQRGVRVYVPEVIDHAEGRTQYMPLFPRYVFAQIDLETLPPSQINTTPGVARLVMFGEAPQPVPAATIQALHQQVHQLNAAGGLPAQTFQEGDTVQITSGPLQGLEAIFVTSTTPGQRVQILLEFMGRLNRVEVERSILTAVHSTPARQRSRRTRGKGRKIKNSI